MNPRSRQAGVTLMELLIAVSLVSLLSVGILMAMRTALISLEKTNARLISNRKSVGAQRVLEQQLAGFFPVMADCLVPAQTAPARIPFFQGEPQSMRFVSTFSLEEAHRGYPHILEFQVIAGARNEGVRLVVNEHLYVGPRSSGLFCLGTGMDPEAGLVPRFPPIDIGPRSFVLADRLAGCRFMYRETLPAPFLERWTPRWVSRQQRWPSAIRVEMAPLDRDMSKIPLLSLTIPVRAQKDPAYEYVDQ